MGREEGSGWGTHVYLWQIHFDIWKNQYNIVKLKKKRMPGKHLQQTTTKTYIINAKEENAQHSGPGNKDTKFHKGQHGQKEVHGLVQSRIKPDDVKNDAISQENDSVHQAEWYRYPDVLCFEPWDPTRVNVADVNSMELL